MKKMLITSVFLGALLITSNVMAATSATWLTPANGSSYAVGTAVTVTGAAGASGGIGLDLALVLDSSGSMASYGGATAQRAAANALVDSLSTVGTSVAVIDFDYYATTVQPLTSNFTAVHTAINGIDATGGTAIDAGVNQAAAELTGANHTAGRQQVMVVMSDGGSTASYAEAAAVNAMAAGVDAIHSVAMGTYADQATLRGMVDGPDDIYGNADDYGTFSAASFADLITLLTGGGLVGVQSVAITDGFGGDIGFSMDGLGNISLNWVIALGQNIFNMHVVGTDGSTADAQWILNGTDGGTNNPVPEPSTIILLGGGLLGLAWTRRKKADK
jgi:Ca-activated chloride channel family protein